MARQATRLRAQCPLPGTRLSFACAVGAAATVAPYLSTDSRGRSPEPLCDLPHRLTGRNTTRNLFAFIAPQRYPSSAAWRWRNSSVESEDPIDTALVPPLERSGDVRYTLTALPALPQLSLLFRREPGPCIHAHTSSSGKIRRCCVDRLRSPSNSVIRRCGLDVRFAQRRTLVGDRADPMGGNVVRFYWVGLRKGYSRPIGTITTPSRASPPPCHADDSRCRSRSNEPRGAQPVRLASRTRSRTAPRHRASATEGAGGAPGAPRAPGMLL